MGGPYSPVDPGTYGTIGTSPPPPTRGRLELRQEPAECARVPGGEEGGGGLEGGIGGATREGPLPVDPPPGGGYLLYMSRVGSVCVLLRQRAPSPFPPSPVWGGLPVVLVVGWLGACPTGGGVI